MSGYPHHSKYFVWLEESRHALLRSVGISYGSMENEGLFFPIIDAKCRFIESVKMDDLLLIYPKIIKVNRRLIKISYDLLNKTTGVKIATAETTNIAVNKDRQIISIPSKYLNVFRHFLKAHTKI
jgi:acyl-CoA thioester hydrolase